MATRRQLICFYGIGSGSDPSRRYVQHVRPEGGWQAFVDEEIRPMIRFGVHRFLLWMPHGRESKTRNQLIGNQWITTNLRYDAWKQAKKNLALNWLTTGFAEAFYPITSLGVEVIAYVGTLHGAPEFDRLSKGQAMWESLKAISPLVDARCSIAIDTSFRSKPGHYVYELAQALKSNGTKCYIEPSPQLDAPHWFTTPVVVSEAQWANVVNPANHNFLAPPSKLKGEIVRGQFDYKPDHFPSVVEWFNWTIPQILKAGHTCCAPLSIYAKAGGSIDHLVP